ncbi:putative integral membrane plasmid transfer protein [Streptomyces formicae]|uniref:Putative integral membrane plasmid transfer protein n=1 Tax=Streptomyces formicae TaxID=1616117 RepID=A0A291QCH1_9ACTN|nr:putative integral membrane plasmid transfer protein [Streptomyces formicae]
MSATEQNLAAAHAEVKAEIARTDTKTSLLLAFVGAVLSIAASVSSLVWNVPWLVAVSALCFTGQVIGWRHHVRQRGGAA